MEWTSKSCYFVKLVTFFLAGLEDINLSKLLDAAKLAVETWRRGFPLFASVQEAFSTIYLKGRMLSRDLTSSLAYALDEAMTLHQQNLTETQMIIKDVLPYNWLTLQLYHLQHSSSLCLIRQQSSLIVSFLKAFQINPNRTFYRLTVKDIIGCKFRLLSSETLKPADYPILDVVHFALISFYVLSTSLDVTFRKKFIKSLVDSIEGDKNNKFFQIVLTLSDILSDAVKNTVSISALPWDMRLFTGSNLSSDTQGWSQQNKIQVLMYYKVVMCSALFFNSRDLQEEVCDWRTLTVMQYSQAVKRGKVLTSHLFFNNFMHTFKIVWN